MTPDRRLFLKTASAAALAGLAGCSNTTDNNDNTGNGNNNDDDVEPTDNNDDQDVDNNEDDDIERDPDEGTPDRNPPNYANLLYDPTEVLGFGEPFFAATDTRRIDNINDLPRRFNGLFRAYIDYIPNAPLEETHHMTFIGSTEPDRTQFGATFVLDGDFDSEEVTAGIIEQYDTETLETSSQRNYAVFNIEHEITESDILNNIIGSSTGTHPLTTTIAVRDNTIILSRVIGTPTTALETTHRMIELTRRNQTQTPYYDKFDSDSRVLDVLADEPLAIGGKALANSIRQDIIDESLNLDSLSELTGVGIGSDHLSQTPTTTIALVYQTPDAASEANALDVVNYMETGEPNTESTTFTDADITNYGRVIKITTDTKPELLRHQYSNLVSIPELDGFRTDSRSKPTISFTYERTESGNYTITHTGGDNTAARTLSVLYTDTDGNQQLTEWDTDYEKVTASDYKKQKVEKLETQIEEVEQDKTDVETAYDEGDITQAEYNQRINEIETELEELNGELDELESEDDNSIIIDDENIEIIAAGDTITTTNPVKPGTQIQVMYCTPNGTNCARIGSHRTP